MIHAHRDVRTETHTGHAHTYTCTETRAQNAHTETRARNAHAEACTRSFEHRDARAGHTCTETRGHNARADTCTQERVRAAMRGLREFRGNARVVARLRARACAHAGGKPANGQGLKTTNFLFKFNCERDEFRARLRGV